MEQSFVLPQLALRRRGLVYLKPGHTSEQGLVHFLRDLAELGFAIDPQDAQWLPQASSESLWTFIQAARELLGYQGRNYQVFHPDFVRSVPAMTDAELYGSQLLHYLSRAWGTSYAPERITPVTQELKQRTCRVVKLARSEDLADICQQLLASSQPFSTTDLADLPALEPFCTGAVEIPVRENLAYLVGTEFAGQEWAAQLRTTTDVLRVAALLSGGDHTLITHTKFNLSRRDRRRVVALLDSVLARGEEQRHLADVSRYLERWKRLLHCLHVQEYQGATRVQLLRQFVHNTGFSGTPKPPASLQSRIDALITARDGAGLVALLQQEPGEYARRLHALIRALPEDRATIVHGFSEVAPKVSARVLVQMWNLFHSAPASQMPYRVILTRKGGSRAKFVANTLQGSYADVIDAIEHGLAGRLADQTFSLPAEANRVAVPLGVRSATPGSRVMGRGSRLPIDQGQWLRLFLHWRDREDRSIDLDLTALFAEEHGSAITKISYTNLREESIGAYHSGDFTAAPEGAAEYIDIDTAACQAAGVRYVVLNCFSYSRDPFGAIPEAYIGVMVRNDPMDGEHFEASEVLIRSDLVGDNRISTPAVFDLHTRELIWLDWTVPISSDRLVNVESSMAELKVLIANAKGSRTMTVTEFLQLTGATISDEGQPIDPMHFEAVSALIDC